MTKHRRQRRKTLPRILWDTCELQVSPTVDNTMFFVKFDTSIEAILDVNTNDGFKSRIRNVDIHVRTESPSIHWLLPVLVDTSAVITNTLNSTDQSIDNLIANAIAGQTGKHWIGRIRHSKDVPGNNVANTASEGVNFSCTLDQRAIALINSRTEEADPVEETTFCLAGFMKTQLADLNVYMTIEIYYDLEVNDIGR